MRNIARIVGALVLVAMLLGVSGANALPAALFGRTEPPHSKRAQVLLVRLGKMTALTLRMDYDGPPQDLALVLPVAEEIIMTPLGANVPARIVPGALMDRLDRLTAPRLAERWELDPCQREARSRRGTRREPNVLGHRHRDTPSADAGETNSEDGAADAAAPPALGFATLAPTDSRQIFDWLTDRGYRVPEGASRAMLPYVAAGYEILVAEIPASALSFDRGRARLPAIQVVGQADGFVLPARLGMLNSPGRQDLVVYAIGTSRFEAANHDTHVIPTGLRLSGRARRRFDEVYSVLVDWTADGEPTSLVTEYAWNPSQCTHCPAAPLDRQDLGELGLDAMPAAVIRSEVHEIGTAIALDNIATSRGQIDDVEGTLRRARRALEACYAGTGSALDGTVTFGLTLSRDGAVDAVGVRTEGRMEPGLLACMKERLRAARFVPIRGEAPVVRFDVRAEPGHARGRPASEGAGDLNLVLTRLRARYDRDALKTDLVLRGAAPITGGTGTRLGGLGEETHRLALANEFEALYTVLHPYRGKVTCSDPVWGRIGSLLPGRQEPELGVAADAAYAPPDAIDLADFVVAPSPDRPAGRGSGAVAPRQEKRSLIHWLRNHVRWVLAIALIALVAAIIAADLRRPCG